MGGGRKRILWGALGAALVAVGWLVVMIVSGVLEQQRQARAPTDRDAGAAEAVPDAGPAAVAEPPSEPVKPRLALVGTVVASDARWSRASILADGERLLSRVGDRLPDGSRLVRILNNRVVLRSANGERWILRLEERPPAADRPPAEEPPPGEESPPVELPPSDPRSDLE